MIIKKKKRKFGISLDNGYFGEIVKFILNSRRQGRRVRTIFRRLRKQDRCSDWRDIALLTFILNVVKGNNLPFSRKEVFSAFKRVDPEGLRLRRKAGVIERINRGGF
ncbi:MAG: hypothetical protein WCW25_03245 [Patescibacteria group bacterium]|jgi:hypothetical protein